MGLFSGGNNNTNFIGVDIGGASIKLVELMNNNGRPQLVTYGYLERSLSGDKIKLVDQPDQTADMIKRVVDSCKALSRRAVTALPSAAVFSAVISIPEILKKDLSVTKKVTTAVEIEAKKILPLPLAEMVLDWKIITSEEQLKSSDKDAGDKVKNLQVLITAAAKEVVQKYIEIFKKAGLELMSLETEGFALARAMVGKDKSAALLVDIGAVGTDISVVENTIPILNRTLGIGGLDISKAIASTLNISLEQAEQFKRDLEGHAGSMGADGDLPELVEKPIKAILDEIKYTINFYLEQPDNKGKKIERIILSGGTASLFNLPKYITEKLKIRAFVGNPWARVIYPEDLQPVLDGIGTRLATSIGLAMRDIE